LRREATGREHAAVDPTPLDDVISVTPAMRPKRRSSGVATEEAIVSGLAPGSVDDTLDISSNDPSAVLIRVPVHVEVIVPPPAPHLVLRSTSSNFHGTAMGGVREQQLW
jgi:hypothetical protein